MRNYLFLIYLTTQLLYQPIFGQDIHFSMYSLSPLTLNPAQTGEFDGDFRIAANHRRQWASVTVPYQTFGVSAEAKSPIRKLPAVSIGLSVYNDKAGDSDFSTTPINFSLAYRIRISADSSQFIIPALQGGVTQRKLNYNKLSFDSQYNGYEYDPSLSNNENFDRTNRVYPNLNLGLGYAKYFGERNQLVAGLSWFNISKPKQSFNGDQNIKLDRRMDIYAMASLKITQKVDVVPSFKIMGQGTFRELVAGGEVKYLMSRSSFEQTAVFLGGWLRSGDAGFVSAGLQYRAWRAGISYDFNYSNLRPASLGRGGYEFAILYILSTRPPERERFKVCPPYI